MDAKKQFLKEITNIMDKWDVELEIDPATNSLVVSIPPQLNGNGHLSHDGVEFELFWDSTKREFVSFERR